MILWNLQKVHAQVGVLDSVRFNKLLDEINKLSSQVKAINDKFDESVNVNKLKNENSQEAKIRLSNIKINDLEKTNKALTKKNNLLDSTNKKVIDSLSLCLKKKNEYSDSLCKQLTRLDIDFKDLKKINQKYDRQFDSLKNNLKENLKKCNKLDFQYVNFLRQFLQKDSNSFQLLNQLNEFLMVQKKLIEIDSSMRMVSFSSFQQMKKNLGSIIIPSNFEGLVKYRKEIERSLNDLIQLVEEIRGWQLELKNFTDAKFYFVFQDKLQDARKYGSKNELFSKYPCLHYFVDKIFESRQTYHIPPTN